MSSITSRVRCRRSAEAAGEGSEAGSPPRATGAEREATPAPERAGAERSFAAEDWALLFIALLILVVPGLFARREAPAPRVRSLPVEPFLIDVETAPWYEWAILEGIGEVRARKIVEFVRSRRPLRSLDELEEVPGLPAGWLEKARPHLRLSGPLE